LQEHENEGRQAQLREAAEALVGWMHARRAAWSDEEPLETAPPPVFRAPPPVLAAAPVSAPPPPVLAAAPVFAPPAAPPDDPLLLDPFDDEVVYDLEPVATKPAEPSLRPQSQTAEAPSPSLVESLVSGAARMAPGAPAMKVAAVVAVLAVGGWLASSYVGNVKTWLTSLTDGGTSSKPEPVAPVKPTRPAVGRRTGQLIAKSEPAGAKVLVDGKERGVTPLTIDDLAFGSHTVVLQSDKGSVRRTVKISADGDAVVSESIYAGWLAVFAAFDIQITEGTSAVRLDESGKVLLSPGPHDLRFENRAVGYQESRRVEILPGETTSLSLVASPSTLSVTASGPAVVLIDGQQVGETPLTNYPIGLGTRDIVVRGADGTERRFTQRVTVAPVQIDVDFSKP
jgi:PEGA domain-containing protein